SEEETRRPRPPPDQPGDRGQLRRHRRRLRPPLARTRSRARAWGGDLSRLLLLRRLGDGDAPLLADPRRFAGEPTQEVELGAPHATLAHQLDLRDRRRVQWEDTLDADARRDLANGECRVDPRTAAADADALERLESLLVALAHSHHHADGVARIERRKVGLEPLALDRPESVHSRFSQSFYASARLCVYPSRCFAHRSGRRSRVTRSASAWRHRAICSWSPLNNTAGTSIPR